VPASHPGHPATIPPPSPASGRPRVVVVPRPLAAFFLERLRSLYRDRPDVQVVVDRRFGERRRAEAPSALRVPERRGSERRSNAVYWSLEDMPCAGTGE
jgi:hypothetical protein